MAAKKASIALAPRAKNKRASARVEAAIMKNISGAAAASKNRRRETESWRAAKTAAAMAWRGGGMKHRAAWRNGVIKEEKSGVKA
jgi:hypothetical protein